MKNRLSRWGIGPIMFATTLTYAVLAGALTYALPGLCLLTFLPFGVCATIAVLLLLLGIPMWLLSVVSVMLAYHRDRLVTTGIFSLVRHPVYASWIVLNLPALALLTRSWPLLLTPLVALAVFKRLVHREDDYLLQHFGPEYLEYRARVNELIPFPRF